MNNVISNFSLFNSYYQQQQQILITTVENSERMEIDQVNEIL